MPDGIILDFQHLPLDQRNVNALKSWLIPILCFRQKGKKSVKLFNPLPHRDAFYSFANRADPDQAALVRAA